MPEMAPIAFRDAQGSNNGSGGTTITMTKPTGTVNGDLMLMSLNARGGSGTTHCFDTYVQPTTLSSSLGPAFATPTYGYALDYTNSYMRCINASTKAVTSVACGTGPTFGTMTPNGSYIYVMDSTSIIKVFRTSDNTLLTTVTLGTAPADYSYSPMCATNSYVFVKDANTSVYVIQVSNNTIVQTLTLNDSNCYRPMASPDGSWIFFTGGTTPNPHVERINTSTWVVTSINLNQTSAFCHFSSNSTYCYVKTWNGIAQIVCSTGAVSYDVPGLGGYVYTSIWDFVLKDDSTIYDVRTINASSSVIIVIDIPSTNTTATLDFSDGQADADATGIAISPNKNSVFFNQNNVAFEISTADNSVTSTHPLPYVTNSSTQFAIPSDNSMVWITTQWDTSFAGVIIYFTPFVTSGTKWHRLIYSGQPYSGTSLLSSVWWAVASSADPSSWVVNIFPTHLASGVIISLSGWDTGLLFGGPHGTSADGQANSSSVNVTTPGITSYYMYGTYNGMSIGLFSTAYGATFTAPAGYTIPANGQSKSTGTTLACASAIAYEYMNAPASIASAVAVASNAAVNIGVSVFLIESQYYGGGTGVSEEHWGLI